MLWFFIRTTQYVVVPHINCRVFLCSNNRTDQYVSLLCLKCCGPSLNLLGWGSSNEKMQHMLLVEKLEKPLRILLESLTLLAPVTKIGEFYKQLRSWWSSSLWAASTRSTLFSMKSLNFQYNTTWIRLLFKFCRLMLSAFQRLKNKSSDSFGKVSA